MHALNDTLNVKTLPLRKLIGCSPLPRGCLLVYLAVVWCGFSPLTLAVDPPPDGGYPNFNTAEGDDALFSLTSGTYNTAIGFQALFNNGGGVQNTASGVGALHENTFGHYNTATGVNALWHNQDGNYNTAVGVGANFNGSPSASTAIGYQALFNSIVGGTAVGYQALYSNTTTGGNTAMGYQALFKNTGSFNTATGSSALFSNTSGSENTATGYDALIGNSTGNYNTVMGYQALFRNTGGSFNTASGHGALYQNISGNYNTADGYGALINNNGTNNTAIGYYALLSKTTGNSNIALGASAGANLTTGSNNIDIGNAGVAGESGKIRIGKQGTQNGTFIAGIAGVAVTGSQMVVNSTGKLGVTTSSKRFKEAINPMDKASEAILALEPVTFRYKQELDPDGIPQFGLIAEQVEKVNPDLVARDADGKVNTVRYEAVNAMLLNEFLKEHRKVQELECKAQKQEAAIAQQQKQIAALTATVQKVSNQLELNKTAPQLVANDQ